MAPVAFEFAGRLATGDGVVFDMVARSFCALAASVGVVIGTNCASADEVIASFEAGGSASIEVPGGLARSVFLNIDSIDDQNGHVASFRLNIYSGNNQIGSQRVTVLEPGGTVQRIFRRTFDRIELVDAEGSVSATIGKASFCHGMMLDENTCTRVGGFVSPAIVVGEASSDAGSISAPPEGENSTSEPTPPAAPADPLEAASADPDLPFFGETTPITRIDELTIQAGVSDFSSFHTTAPWVDQIKLTKVWSYYNGADSLSADQVMHNAQGMPTFPADHDPSSRAFMGAGVIWAGSTNETLDLAGTWQLRAEEGTVLTPRIVGATVLSKTDTEITFQCVVGTPCRFDLRLRAHPEGNPAPTLIKIADRFGNPLTDAEDHANGMVSRSQWRKAMYGYTDIRMLRSSGALAGRGSLVRFDQFPTMEDASWANMPLFASYRADEGKVARQGLTNFKTGTGMQSAFSPALARLKLANELDAVYHHNFPPYFLEYKAGVVPEIIGQWAIDHFNDPELTDEQKLSLFNDYELQHVDEFGAVMKANQHLIPKNQVKVEVSNEVWNYAWPYSPSTKYFLRKGEYNKIRKGWDDQKLRASLFSVQVGYDLTKSVARLRKLYPEIEWRGVMAVHTPMMNRSSGNANAADPQTPSGFYNRSLHGMIKGYELFWAEYEQNQAEWSEIFAPEPAQVGDWFEAQGTTYFTFEAVYANKKTHIGGVTPEAFAERVEDPSEWEQLRMDVLEWFINDSADRGKTTDEYGMKSASSSLFYLERNFRALAEHGALYGMQVTSYEGGTHGRLGTSFKGKTVSENTKLFWRDFHDSVEYALIQAAVHDRAVEAGWMGLSDFDVFQPGTTSNYIFGARKHFEDVTPRYCEYARWMPLDRPAPAGMTLNDVVHPQIPCGGLIDYINQARANDYYVGETIPHPSAFIN